MLRKKEFHDIIVILKERVAKAKYFEGKYSTP